MSQSQEKIDAIYDLRDAAAAKARLELALDQNPSPTVRDALLDATLDVEAKTQHAIEVCHECGHVHGGGEHINGRQGNVIRVNFGENEGDAV